MLHWTKALAIAGVGALFGAAVTASAATYGDRYVDEGIMAYGQIGGGAPLANLNAQGGELETGFNAGAGLGYQINEYLAVRGNFNFTTSAADSTAIPAFNNEDFDRYFYDLDLQVRYPTESGLAPYAILGGGGVTVDPEVPGMDSFTEPDGKLGAGVGYHFRDHDASLFAELSGWIYGWDEPAVDRTQFDSAWTGGLRYAF